MSLIGVKVHEGNSMIFSLFWFSFLTIPIGLLVFLILVILEIGKMIKERIQKKKRDRDEN